VEFVLGSSSTIQRPTLAAVREALGDEAINLLRDDADRLRAQTGLVVNQWSIFDETPGALD
jgi:hypothetical protein